MNAITHNRANLNSRSGVTLLLTLGVLTVLSVMVVTFLLTARHQSLSAKYFRDKTVARQALDVALVRAMQFADGAMIESAYNDSSSQSPSAANNPRRVYPIGRWYSDFYNKTNGISSSQVHYQDQDILLVPITNIGSASSFPTNVLTVDLLTDEVRLLLPPALTNRFGSATRFGSAEAPLRSGWITDLPSGFRVSFAVLNCSGFIDAHCYDSASNVVNITTQQVPRVYFSQQDLLHDSEGVAKAFISDSSIANQNPFFTMSYDPNPNVMPLDRSSVNVVSNLGTRTFASPEKFNINSISNNFLSFAGIAGKRRLVEMSDQWFKNVTNALNSSTLTDLNNIESQDGRDAYFGDVKKVAWNVVNYMTESRVPSAFSNTILEQTNNYPSRLAYAIEAVPLINEVKLKDIYTDPGTKIDEYSGALSKVEEDLNNLYTINGKKPDIEWSNIFAFDVELWYPFKPVPPPENTYLWLSVTTNSPSLFIPTVGPSGWLDDDEIGDSLGTVLFDRWNKIYVSSLSSNVTNDLVWEAIQTNAVLLTYVENPTAFDTATNQTEIAQAFSDLWLLTYTNNTGSVTNTTQPYTVILETTTLQYTNQITQAVLSNDIASVNTILHTPYREWANGDFYANELLRRFNESSAAQFAEYERFEIPDNIKDQEFLVFHSTNLVYFPYMVTNPAATDTDPKSVTIRFSPLNKDDDVKAPDDPNKKCEAWLRPMVTVCEIQLPVLGLPGIPETVDEALLNRTFKEEDGHYKKWERRGSISIDEPRDNVWTEKWSEQDAMTESMGDGIQGERNVNFNPHAEYPFIHYDRPFLSIGELGYINTAIFTNIVNGTIEPPELRKLKHPSGIVVRRDTIDLSTRSGASLIDKFSTGAIVSPTHGLIQANTLYGEVVQRILNQIPLGTPETNDANEKIQLADNHSVLWTDLWTNTLLKTYAETPPDPNLSGFPGWTCFGEMLPDLGTNAIITKWEDPNQEHDTTEDVLRGIIDKVSFRQNIFVIIVAAQALSPVSTEMSPVVLADQRAAVTVIRDAYTGRWTVHSWTLLTE